MKAVQFITTTLFSLSLVALSSVAHADDDGDPNPAGCGAGYDFDSEGTGTFNCSATRQIFGTVGGSTYQTEFICNGAAGMIQDFSGDKEFYFDVGLNCFEFSDAGPNSYPTQISFDVRDQSGAGGPVPAVVHIYTLSSPFTPTQTFTVPTARGVYTFVAGEYGSPADPITAICLERPAGGDWSEATFDDICVEKF